LDRVQKPGRYLGGEVGAVVKDPADLTLRVALAFPDIYEIGMSHLGLKILYDMINRVPRYWAERVMAPWLDREADLKRRGQRLGSLESGLPLSDFDLVGFSLQYELSYVDVLNMLDLAGIPLRAEDRGEGGPLIVGGGSGAANPEPLADFFDFFFLGDAEAGFLDVLAEIESWKRAGGSKGELRARLAGRPGIYVPLFFEPAYGPDGRLAAVRPVRPGYDRVHRAIVPDLDEAPFPIDVVVPYTKPVHDRLAIEISRGCTRGCRFCQAGYLYRPVRERSPGRVLDLAGRSLDRTGYDDVSFLSLSAGDYTCLPRLMTAFMDAHSGRRVALSLPSLRVKSLTPEMMAQIKRVRKTGFTLAPEAGTQRLRDVINKDLTEADLLLASREAFALGWRLIKLYFMIGLPTETEEDVLAIADLAGRVRTGTRSQVNASFALFVPKPHTPFQWEPMLAPEEASRRMDGLRSRLRAPGLRPKWNRDDMSLVEGILARGDRRLGPVLLAVLKKGGRLQAWTEQFRRDFWLEGLAEAGLDPHDYTRGRDRNEVLPWSHIQAGADDEFLWAEREKAYQGLTSPDCRSGLCGGCGVCDFDEIKPRFAPPDPEPAVRVKPSSPGGPVLRFKINYLKQGLARLLGHLETAEVFHRAFRRAGLDLHMSQGFHPKPRLHFLTPLPLGLSSLDEYLVADLVGPPGPDEVAARLNGELPEGFRIVGAEGVALGRARPQAEGARYMVRAADPLFEPGGEGAWLSAEALWIEKNGKKEPRRVDLKPLLRDVSILTPRSIDITLFFGEAGSVRPQEAAAVLFGLSPETQAGLEVEKIETLLREG